MTQRAAAAVAMAMLALSISSCSAVEDFGDEDDGAPAERSPAQREKYTFTLEHDVTGTGGSFTSRNEVSYEGSIGLPAAGSKRRPTIRVSKFSFSADELDSIDKLARSGGVYRIRAPTSVKGDSEGYVMSYVPACALVASRYTEHLVFHLGRNGNILGVDLDTPNSQCSTIVPRQSKKKVNVVSTVRVDLGMDAEKPTMPEKFEEMLKDNSGGGGGSKKRKEEEDPGIFRKYWYIWPILLFMSMGGGDDKRK